MIEAPRLNKVVYVKANFKQTGRNISVRVPTGEKKSGFFGRTKELMRKETRWEQTGSSDCEIDGVVLTADLAAAIQDLNAEGYEVVSVLPVTSGRYAFQTKEGHIWSAPRIFGDTEKVSGKSGYSYGYGYSFTEGVIIVARKDVIPI